MSGIERTAAELIFGCCCPRYWRQFGPAWAVSAADAGYHVLLVVTGAAETELGPDADAVRDYGRGRITIRAEPDGRGKSPAWLASRRFMLLPDIMRGLGGSFHRILVMDIDLVLTGPAPCGEEDLTFRGTSPPDVPDSACREEWKHRYWFPNAGLVALRSSSYAALSYADSVRGELIRLAADGKGDSWYVDQIALQKYLWLGDQLIRTVDFRSFIFDRSTWEDREEAATKDRFGKDWRDEPVIRGFLDKLQ